MVWNEKTHWLKVWGHTVVRKREIICQDPRADGEQTSKLRVRSQITSRSMGSWKRPMREVYRCRFPAHFHGLDGQSGSARGKGHSKHVPLPPPAQQSQPNPLRARKGLCRTLCRWSEMSLSGSQGFLSLGSGRDEDEDWECVTFHESSSLGHHALYTGTLPLLLESVGVGPGKEGPSVWPQALQPSIQSMIRTAKVIIIQGENPLQPQICWQNLWIPH